MKKHESNRVNMIRATVQFCTDNVAATAGIPAFAPAIALAKSKLGLIDQLNQTSMSKTEGVTLDTNKIRRAMSILSLKCSSSLSAFAHSSDNDALLQKIKFTLSELNNFKKEEVDDVCQFIHDEADANLSSITAFGLQATDVTDLQNAIDLYRNAIQNPRQAIISRSQANNRITELIREIIHDVFIRQIDPMVNTLVKSNPDFEESYFQARYILNLGKNHTKLTGKVTDLFGNPIPGVKVSVRETSSGLVDFETQTKSDGTFSITGISPGDEDLVFESPGFEPVKEQQVHFSPGVVVRKEIMLKAVV